MEDLFASTTTTFSKSIQVPNHAQFSFHLKGKITVEAAAYRRDHQFESLTITSPSAVVTFYLKSHEIRAFAEAIRTVADGLDEQYQDAAELASNPPPTKAELAAEWEDMVARANDPEQINLPF